MKKTNHLILAAAITLTTVVSCKKSNPATTSTILTPTGTVITNTVTDTYSSVNAFFAENGVAMQTYTINGNTGGSFTSPQGTIVNIPPNAFVTQLAAPITGNITLQFKDIYKKSDMLLSNMPTTTYYGTPLKSGGEFFIKALSGGVTATLATGKKITVTQPAALTGGIDLTNKLIPFIRVADTVGHSSWGSDIVDSVLYTTSDYVFSLYKFNSPVDSGSWCNSDNSSYFAAYPQTTLTMVPTTSSLNSLNMSVFLVFKNIASMVHVYYNSGTTNFPYAYAPQGLACTVVAIGVDSKGALYSSFVPVSSIGANQTVNFSLTATSTGTFISQLKALD